MLAPIFTAVTVLAATASAITIPAHVARNVSEVLKRTPGQVVTQCTVPNTVALTFNGVARPTYDAALDGNNYDCIYSEDLAKRVKYAYDKGHQVALHTWSHAHLPSLTFDQVDEEMMSLVEDAIEKITGAYPAMVRPRIHRPCEQKAINALALNHEVYEQSAHDILPHAISVLKAAGYKLVTFAECIGQSPYMRVGSPKARDDSWTCENKPSYQL
ncbi:carbohydrate esterase family 4 protein [Ephemerocybe angulata]|uniref:Carbohydrate esterase family 4 protein n=1 Tax=Ephemerocybe angulata TaxID=980116 RepID=A0A8H6ME01_9AGAR|nr:carbohydrate esterase family 4 protein [Tulosesus angulatus]